jgi:hypothetical protein
MIIHDDKKVTEGVIQNLFEKSDFKPVAPHRCGFESRKGL